METILGSYFEKLQQGGRDVVKGTEYSLERLESALYLRGQWICKYQKKYPMLKGIKEDFKMLKITHFLLIDLSQWWNVDIQQLSFSQHTDLKNKHK